MKHEQIIVLDCGSRNNQLLTRMVRKYGVYSEVYPHTITLEDILSIGNVKGIILSGGPQCVSDELKLDEAILTSGIPVLGIAYGMDLLSSSLKGKIVNEQETTSGKTVINKEDDSSLLSNLHDSFSVQLSDYYCDDLPICFKTIAKSESNTPVIIKHETQPLYGISFYPEIEKFEVLENFIIHCCEVSKNWSVEHFITEEIKRIKETVGDKKVLLGLSGGVDSSVAAVLIHQAIENQLTCIFVDHGLLRKGESEQVIDTFKTHFKMNLIPIDAKDRFLLKLKGVTDPEQKRKIIGHEFIEVFNDEAKKLGTFDFLAQGTIYADVIESGSQFNETIKSHHNVGGLPDHMNFKLLEPLDRLFKDEVREVGEALGLSKEIVWRQPFPGPGLGIRVMGEVTEEKLNLVRESDAILREEIKNAGLQDKIWQYFTVLTNTKTVGVMNDKRTYAHTLAIRAVNSIDGMTADWAKIPWDVLAVISNRIIYEIDGINRVVYDITAKPPGTIEWE